MAATPSCAEPAAPPLLTEEEASKHEKTLEYRTGSLPLDTDQQMERAPIYTIDTSRQFVKSPNREKQTRHRAIDTVWMCFLYE